MTDLTYRAHFNKIKEKAIKAAKEERTSIVVYDVKPHTIQLLEAEGLEVKEIDFVNYKSFQISCSNGR